MSIENWKTDLAPLLYGFQTENTPWRKPEPDSVFTDQFGNWLSLGYYSAISLLKLLRNPSLKTVVSECDKGYHGLTVYQHDESYYIVYESRVNLDGVGGSFTSFVIIPNLDELIRFAEDYKTRKEEEYM